jgi:transcriptional regulator with XRE-family HTH domain
MGFKENLAEALKNINISSLARKIDVSHETIRSILAGRSGDPRLLTVMKLAKALDMPLDELVYNKKSRRFSKLPYDKHLLRECFDFIETYIDSNELGRTVDLEQLFCAMDAMVDHTINNNAKTIDKQFASWVCKKFL